MASWTIVARGIKLVGHQYFVRTAISCAQYAWPKVMHMFMHKLNSDRLVLFFCSESCSLKCPSQSGSAALGVTVRMLLQEHAFRCL